MQPYLACILPPSFIYLPKRTFTNQLNYVVILNPHPYNLQDKIFPETLATKDLAPMTFKITSSNWTFQKEDGSIKENKINTITPTSSVKFVVNVKVEEFQNSQAILKFPNSASKKTREKH